MSSSCCKNSTAHHFPAPSSFPPNGFLKISQRFEQFSHAFLQLLQFFKSDFLSPFRAFARAFAQPAGPCRFQCNANLFRNVSNLGGRKGWSLELGALSSSIEGFLLNSLCFETPCKLLTDPLFLRLKMSGPYKGHITLPIPNKAL